MHVRLRHGVLAIGSIVLLAAVAGVAAAAFNVRLPQANAASHAPNLHVAGTSLLDAANNPVFLRGVNYSGGEYACIQGWGIFDGPSDQAFADSLLSAHVNAVRLPMNEDCWLGINGAAAAYSGANYRNAFVSFVNVLTTNGITPELDLQWNAPGTQRATGTKAMPDADHSGAFWQSVATTFAGRTDVIFDLYNEPHPSSWNIWQNGGSDGGFTTIGMQSLVTIVRNAGFHGVLSLSGIDYANTLGGTAGWLAHKPSDPDKNLVAAVHVYKGNTRQSTSAWNSDFGPVAAQVPLLNNELGAYCYDDSCVDSNFSVEFWAWLNSVGGDGTFAWTWDTWGTVESLVSNYNGPVLTSWGQQVKAQFAKYSASAPPAPSETTAPPPPQATTPPGAATPKPTTPPAGTVSPNTTPPAPAAMALLQSANRLTDFAATHPSFAKFPNKVREGHLLVAVVSIAGGNPYSVSQVKDTLGNTWTKGVAGVNGDNTDVEIWYTNSTTSGVDKVSVSVKAGAGASSRFVQSYLTIAEFNGSARYHAGHESGSSSMGTHSSGEFASTDGDLIVGGYADAGYVGALAATDGKQVLGEASANTHDTQAIASYGTAGSTTSSVAYSNPHFARAEVAGASFTPDKGAAVLAPSAARKFTSVPCTVTINGQQVRGICSGSIAIKP